MRNVHFLIFFFFLVAVLFTSKRVRTGVSIQALILQENIDMKTGVLFCCQCIERYRKEIYLYMLSLSISLTHSLYLAPASCMIPPSSHLTPLPPHTHTSSAFGSDGRETENVVQTVSLEKKNEEVRKRKMMGEGSEETRHEDLRCLSLPSPYQSTSPPTLLLPR